MSSTIATEPAPTARRVTDDHIAHLREHGYALVEEFLTPDELAAARDHLFRIVPRPEAPDETPFHNLECPFADGEALNDMALHPAMIDYVERVLGTTEVAWNQSLIFAKYPGPDFSQQHHCDFMNNTLVFPRDEGDYRQVNVILYYSDVTPDLGPTCVLPYSVATLRPGRPVLTADEHPDLYAREVQACLPAGGALIYAQSTYHRGSAFTATSGARFSHHFVYRPAARQYMGWTPWPKISAHPGVVGIIERATPRQRELLGFPAVGDPYWTEETIAGTAARYPGLDPTPYREALAAR